MSNQIVDGKVEPLIAYQPRFFVTPWFKVWALKCGACEKDFYKFSFFGKPRCPYCNIVNIPQLFTVC